MVSETQLKEIFQRVKSEVVKKYPDLADIRLLVGCEVIEKWHARDPHSEGLADMLDRHICFIRTDLEKIPYERAVAVMWHEFGHHIDFRYGSWHLGHFAHQMLNYMVHHGSDFSHVIYASFLKVSGEEQKANQAVLRDFGVHIEYVPVREASGKTSPFLSGYWRVGYG